MNKATTIDDIRRCYTVLSQLRPHLSEEQFVNIVQRMREHNHYELVYLESDNEVVAVAGIRLAEWLHTGKYLEIEDLVTHLDYRSQGFGGTLFDQIVSYARQNECNQVRLVSGVQRVDAHRFYLEKGMTHEAKYFSINLGSA